MKDKDYGQQKPKDIYAAHQQQTTSNSHQKGWPIEFQERFVRKQNDSGQFINGTPVEWEYISGKVEDLKSFIKEVEEEAYQRGRKECRDKCSTHF
jgi:hypothetical protein